MFTPILAIVVTSVSPLPQSDTFQLPASLVSSAALLRNAGNDASRFNGEMEWYRSRSGAATVLEAVNQSVKTNLSGFNYGEEPGIYIYIQKIRACHLRQITALAVSCIAITPDEKTCPDVFRNARARLNREIEKSSTIYIYIHIGHLWFGEKAASSPLQGE